MSFSFVRDRSVGVKLGFGFGIVLVLLCAAVALGVQSAEAHQQLRRRQVRLRRHPAARGEQDLVTQMVNQETGVRGFLVTADNSSLDP